MSAIEGKSIEALATSLAGPAEARAGYVFEAETDENIAGTITRGRRRIRRWAGVAAVVLATVWAGWWWDSDRLYRAELTAVRQRGGVVTLADLHRGSGTGGEASEIITAASNEVRLTPAQSDVVYGRERRFRVSLPFGGEEHERALEAEAGNARVFELLASLKDAGRFELSHEAHRRVALTVRRLSELVRVAALAAHQDGRHEAALARVDELIALGDACDRSGTLGGHTAACVAYTTASDVIIDVSPDLQIGPGEARARVRALVDRLADDRSMVVAFCGAIDDERAARFDYIARSNPGGVIFAPALRRDAAYFSRACTELHAAAANSSWQQLESSLPRDYLSLGDHVVRPAITSLRTNFEQVAMMHCRAMVDRRAAALRLAMRLYEVAKGKPAERPEDVVPTCIAAVPVDVFDVKGAKLRYTTEGGVPRIYSVDVDGADQGGQLRTTISPRPFRWRDMDSVYPLVRLRPPRMFPEPPR